MKRNTHKRSETDLEAEATKTGRFHFSRGWHQVEVHLGEPIAPEFYLLLPREDVLEFMRRSIVPAKPPSSVTIERLPTQAFTKLHHQNALLYTTCR